MMSINNKILYVFLILIFSFYTSYSQNDNFIQETSIIKKTGSSNYFEAHLQSFDTIKLESLVRKINNGKFGDIHSLIISRNNQIVLEKYFSGYDRDSLHRLYSVTKSVTSALLGIAFDNGKINGLDDTLLDFFPEYSQIENMNPKKESVSLEQVLSMASGFEWDEWTNPYGNSNNSATILWRSDDMLKHMLDLPLSHTPGTQFTYNSGCSILLSGIIRNKTGLSAEEYAASNLFSKIGIEEWVWQKGSDGLTWTSGELFLKPLDMLKFGQLYLNKGKWLGKEVVSESWVENSTAKHISATTYNDYGFHWWKYKENHPVFNTLQEHDIFYGVGHGGQFIWVIPQLNMVVVSTAGNSNWSRQSEPILWWDILPAIINK